MPSIKREIFQSSALLALIVVTVFGVFLSTLLYYSEVSKAQAIINRSNHAVVLFVERNFSEIINTITMLDEKKDVRDAMVLGEGEHQRLLDEYRSLLKANRNITYIYSGYENGLMLINGYTPPEGFDPRLRPWYQAAMKAKPQISIGLPYQDIVTKEWLIATSKALRQANGEYVGVVAIDCSFEQIVSLIARHDEYKTEFSFVMDKAGTIIMHADQALLGTSRPEIRTALQQATNGNFTYRNGDIEYFAYSRPIAATGWTVVTLVAKREILHPVISKVVLLICLTGVIALFLGFVQSIVLARRFSRPVSELGKKINAAIAGNSVDDDDYHYPNNEIGIMAREIGQLARRELYAKTHDLHVSEERYRLLIEHAVSAVASHRIVWNEAGDPVDYVFLSANPAFETHTGLKVTDILGRKFTEVIPGVDKPPFIEMYSKVVLTGESVSFEQYSELLGRHYFINAFRMGEGCFGTIFIDITERKRIEDAVRENEETYKTILMASPDDITIADLSGRIIMVSEAAHRIFGYDPEEGPGMSILDFIVPEDHARARANIARMFEEDYRGPNEYRAIRKDRSCFDIEVNNALIHDRQGNPVRMVLIVRDITSRKKAEQQIQELIQQLEIERDLAEKNSLTDSLTGLYNRRFFDIALHTEFLRHKRSGSQLSLIMLDVDHFKAYNDTYGHLAGDECLKQIGQTLRTAVERAPDIVARFGGEEFVVLLPDTDSHGAEMLAKRIGESVARLTLPHAKSAVSEFVSVSLGLATTDDRILAEGSELVALADRALYHAKKNGRNRYEVFTRSF